jgi:hypothetical protein
VTDSIAEALDGFVPAFDSIRGDWQAIVNAASLPAAVSSADRQMPTARQRGRKRGPLARRAVRVVVALAVLAVITTGVTWAAGAFDSPSPQSLFKSSFPADSGAGDIFQKVIPHSVEQVESVEIPKLGPIAVWHADTKEGGWCLGLRLSDGSWLGTSGCFPTGVIDGGNHHLEWTEADIAASSAGGSPWRIRSGVITVPGAVKVTDLATGTSTKVVDGNVFVLAIQAPDPTAPPYQSPKLHLVAYDKAGNVIASDCLYHSCSGG